ncbi:MAG: hypothetical protein AB7F65_01790 [Dehalococcoidia bacterium]
MEPTETPEPTGTPEPDDGGPVIDLPGIDLGPPWGIWGGRGNGDDDERFGDD